MMKSERMSKLNNETVKYNIPFINLKNGTRCHSKHNQQQ